MVRKGAKAVIIGAGNVGATTAYTLLISGQLTELVIIDINRGRAQGEVLDLAHGIPLCPPAEIKLGEYPDCTGADIVIIAAGFAHRSRQPPHADPVAAHDRRLELAVRIGVLHSHGL